MKRIIIISIAVFIANSGFGQFIRNTNNGLDSVNVPATFPGGQIELEKYVSENLYMNDKIDSGVVIIEFDVWADGTLHNWNFIKKMSNPQNNRSAVFLFLKMPKWNPGYNEKDKPLNSKAQFEIKFNPTDWNGTSKYNPGKDPQDIEPLPQKQEDQFIDFSTSGPEFPGGKDSLNLFIENNLEYPETDATVSGVVYLQFIVWSDGFIGNFKIMRGLNKEFDAAAIDVFTKSPKWIPGKDKDGKPVNVRYTLPVRFK